MSEGEELQPIRVTTEWTSVTVVDGPDVVCTFRGYTPVLPVRRDKEGDSRLLYISAKSLMEALEPLRRANGGFQGLQFSVRKESKDKYARYEVRSSKDRKREIDIQKFNLKGGN